MYRYKAYVRRAYDGDTITCDIDLGFGVVLQSQNIRLIGLNAPEVRGKSRQDGLKSRDALRSKIVGKWIILETKKDKKGKYGRWLGNIWLEDECINDWLISEGYAEKY